MGASFGRIKVDSNMSLMGKFEGFPEKKVHCLGWEYNDPCWVGSGWLEVVM